MKLNDMAVRKAKPEVKPYKIADGWGMYLEVMPTGSKYWRFKYRFGGKEKRLAFGVYPDVSLSLARTRRDDARKLLANEIDPGLVKQQSKRASKENAANSFETLAREWFAKFSPHWAPSHAEKTIRRLENDVCPWMGSKPIANITPPQLLAVIRRTETRGALDTAHRVKQNCGQVFRYAVATGRAERDPSQDLKDAIPSVRKNHYASITDPKQVGELLRAIEGFRGTFVVQCALTLAPMLFVRPGELRRAEWKDIDFDKAEWRYFVTKTKTEQTVPLAKQSVAVLRELEALTGYRQLCVSWP
jgi:integrase